jgi:DNA topoisomerase-3
LFGCQYYGSGKAADILFKTTGKEILKKKDFFEDPNAKEKRSRYLAEFCCR